MAMSIREELDIVQAIREGNAVLCQTIEEIKREALKIRGQRDDMFDLVTLLAEQKCECYGETDSEGRNVGTRCLPCRAVLILVTL